MPGPSNSGQAGLTKNQLAGPKPSSTSSGWTIVAGLTESLTQEVIEASKAATAKTDVNDSFRVMANEMGRTLPYTLRHARMVSSQMLRDLR